MVLVGTWAQYALDVRGLALPTGPFVPEEAPGLVVDVLKDFLDEGPAASSAPRRAQRPRGRTRSKRHDNHRPIRALRCVARGMTWWFRTGAASAWTARVVV